jgi:hypothetical protein
MVDCVVCKIRNTGILRNQFSSHMIELKGLALKIELLMPLASIPWQILTVLSFKSFIDFAVQVSW